MLTTLTSKTAAAVAAGVLLTGGVAAATTGSLPDRAQDVAKTVFGTVGLSVPAGQGDKPAKVTNENVTKDVTSDSTPDAVATDAATDEATPATASEESEAAEPDGAKGKGAEISELAHTTEATGAAKGAEISDAASEGRSHAGEEHATSPGASTEVPTTDQVEPTDPPETPAGDQATQHGHSSESHSEGAGD